jgi:hypothetical protein
MNYPFKHKTAERIERTEKDILDALLILHQSTGVMIDKVEIKCENGLIENVKIKERRMQ